MRHTNPWDSCRFVVNMWDVSFYSKVDQENHPTFFSSFYRSVPMAKNASPSALISEKSASKSDVMGA